MTVAYLDGDPPIEITLRRSGRARRLSLRVSALDGRVTLTLPDRARAADALDFARERADWILAAQARASGCVTVADGAVFPVEGRPVTVSGWSRRGPQLADGVLSVPAARPGAAALAFLKTLARERLAAASDNHAQRLGVGYRTITLRDTRSRWGSCTSEGRLMYSWRLIMAPPEVLDYVAAHEVAHLVKMDHSPAFWRVVEELCPAWARHRDWLRAQGPALHRVRFDHAKDD